MSTKSSEKPPQPSKPKPKRNVLEQLRIRQRDQAEIAKASRAGATPPALPKPPAPPRALSPAQLAAAAAPAPPPAQPPPPPQPPPGGEQQAEGNVLEILFARAMRNRSDTKPADDPGMAILQSLTHLIQHGKPLKTIEDIIIPHLGESPSKRQLFRNAMRYHNVFERGSLLALARWTLEKSLWEDLINQRLSPVEKLALLQLAIKEMDKVQDGLDNDDDEDTSKGSAADIEAAAERSDRPLTKTVDPTSKDLEGTSPVGRELARRLVDRAGKAAEKLVEETLKKP